MVQHLTCPRASRSATSSGRVYEINCPRYKKSFSDGPGISARNATKEEKLLFQQHCAEWPLACSPEVLCVRQSAVIGMRHSQDFAQTSCMETVHPTAGGDAKPCGLHAVAERAQNARIEISTSHDVDNEDLGHTLFKASNSARALPMRRQSSCSLFPSECKSPPTYTIDCFSTTGKPSGPITAASFRTFKACVLSEFKDKPHLRPHSATAPRKDVKPSASVPSRSESSAYRRSVISLYMFSGVTSCNWPSYQS